MKKIIAGCIDTVIEFDTITAFDKYIDKLNGRYAYKVVKQVIKADGIVIARIKRRYNSNSKFMEFDGDSYL